MVSLNPVLRNGPFKNMWVRRENDSANQSRLRQLYPITDIYSRTRPICPMATDFHVSDVYTIQSLAAKTPHVGVVKFFPGS